VSQEELYAQDGTAGGNPLVTRGVYVSTLEGRVYCLDWQGPVTKGGADHADFRTWDGTGDSAEELNDNFRFRNQNDTGDNLTARGTHGTIRPRWVFPNRYTDINAAYNRDDDPDNASARRPGSGASASVTLAQPSNLGPIYSAPSLMDFPFDDDNNPATPAVTRHYVVVAANDPSSSGSPATGNLYLLDAAGDRRSFLTNPFVRGAAANAVAISHPLDRFAARAPLGNATPAWTYRFQYDSTPVDPQERNAPKTDPADAVPSRRLLPTVFAGGVGRMYAVDIDFATGVFTRWRGTVAAQRQLGPVPTLNAATPFNVPANIAANDPANERLDPPNLAVEQANLEDRPVLARTVDLRQDGSRVDGQIVISGGPLQNRGDAPPRPTNTPLGFDVNQDINDPLSDTRGTTPDTEPGDPNVAFQYPALFITTASGLLHELSTNIEGEDPSTITAPGFGGESSALGWAFTTDTARANPDHVQLDTIQGPGGTSGVSIVTNAYFPDLDPANTTYTNGVPPGTPFRPRSLAAGDAHTGLTGFPLDHNGLLYDPLGPAANQTGNVRLPNYGANGVPNGSVPVNLLAPPDPTLDDVNPEANRVAWIFGGGADGAVYAITPAPLGGGGGGYGNTPPGSRVQAPRLSDRGDPKVDIFTVEDFLALRAAARAGTPIRPDRDGRLGGPYQSRAARGLNNFYEWGETIPIVIWDVNALTTDPNVPAALQPSQGQYYATGNSVRITIVNRQTGATLLSTDVPIERGPGGAGFYPFDPRYQVPEAPAGTEGIPLGVAFFEYRLGESSGSSPQTPGAYLEIRVAQTVRVDEGGGAGIRTSTIARSPIGANSLAILNNLFPVFAIANPIGVQAFLADTGTAFGNAGVAVPSGNPNANGIGPFANNDAAKTQVSITPGGPADDPDRAASRYSQALANGNLIERRDFRPYLSTGTSPVRNPQFTLRLPNDPLFYLPVAAGAGYAGHGATGSTDIAPNRRNLRLLNRSRLDNGLNRVRVARADLLRRSWPGDVPNGDATDPGIPGNPRKTPNGMRTDGVINPLPWETPPLEVQPWKRAGVDLNPNGSVSLGINPSQDYPDIGRDAILVNGPAGEMTRGRASLPGSGVNNFQVGVTDAFASRLPNVGATVNIKVPRYQPANLVAIDSLTSTYVAPNSGDGVLVGATEGPVQLPRATAGSNIDARRLVSPNGAAIVPFGYTARLFVYVDSNNDGRLNIASNVGGGNTGVDFNNRDIQPQAGYEEAYREFEVWVGVPVDMKLKAVESIVDLGSVPHGFAVQNGLLGYNDPGLPAPLNLGFVPPRAPNATPATNFYNAFYKNFSIQNLGNVNLWNLRAAQRTSPSSTGVPFRDLGLVSDIVDPRFGVFSLRADPAGVVGNIVTSLDRPFDPIWNNDVSTLTDPSGTPPFVYPDYYAQFAGRHTLHKAQPGSVSPTLLSLPDSPDSASVPRGVIVEPKVGVAVPIGTPVGSYRAPLAIFEDHDTDQQYRPAPIPVGTGARVTQILPAGPLYAGTNAVHPGANAIRGGVGAEGVLRPRREIYDANGNRTGLEYLPYTDPSFLLKVSVNESFLTGQVADTAGSDPLNILGGLLPSVDLFPLLDLSLDASRPRPASALTPAAFRSRANGRLHVYFSRNATEDGAAAAQPGNPFRLFRTHLDWNMEGGFFQASNFGSLIADPSLNTGRWFTPPVAIGVPGQNPASNAFSNTSPFVLHDTVDAQGDTSAAGDGATLFWLNTQSTTGGAPVSNIYFQALDPATGEPAGTATPYLANPDPSFRRFGPRAAIAYPNGVKTTFVFYFGGVSGRSGLYYGATASTAGGAPADNPSRERQLVVPAALSSASEASPVARFYPFGKTNPNQSDWVIDVYYTGISRTNQNPDIYMTRYRVTGTGPNARLDPVRLARLTGERLSAPGRSPGLAGAPNRLVPRPHRRPEHAGLR
jgi:hypothetical protein